MNLTKNIVSFLNSFIIESDSTLKTYSESTIMMLQCELATRGYMFDNITYTYLSSHKEYTIKLYNELLPFIDTMLGEGEFKPFYKGFPEDVLNLDESERYMHQFLHYWSNGSFIPETNTTRHIAFEKPNYKVIKLGNEEDLLNIFEKITSTSVALTDMDVNIFDWFIANYDKSILSKHVSNKLQFKELMCKLIDFDLYVPKTTTDVLRYCVYLSGGDVSLPCVPPAMIKQRFGTKRINTEREAFKFKKFNNKTRLKILSLLENSNLDVREMKLHINRWLRIGEIVHPGKYEKRFPKTFNAFNKLRNEKVKSWYGELLSLSCIMSQAEKCANERPGEFARRLDYFIRNTEAIDEFYLLIEYFNIAIEKGISNKVLFELYEHFSNRDKENIRLVNIKGHKTPVKLTPLKPLSSLMVNDIKKAILDGIKINLSHKDKLKGFYIVDENLKNIPLPLNMRTMSSSLDTKIRGQRIPIKVDEKETLRFYLHWEDESGNKDLDLSAVCFDAEFKCLDIFSYNKSYKNNYGLHSGDVRHRKGKCAEYIDINVKEAKEHGVSYVLCTAINFDHEAMQGVKAFSGYMMREKPECNTHWLPNTIENSFVLESEGREVILGFIDLTSMEYVVLDMSHKGDNTASNNVKYYKDIIYKYKNIDLSVYDLIKMNINSRGGAIFHEEVLNDRKIIPECTYNVLRDTATVCSCDSYKDILMYM